MNGPPQPNDNSPFTNHDHWKSLQSATLALREDARGTMITEASAHALAQFYLKEECFL